jgi:hypothetical protein
MQTNVATVNGDCRRMLNKHERILQSLAQGRRLTRFDAELLGDHCLPSTVARLQKRGVTIQRELVKREGSHGQFHCCVYWISEADKARARRILEGAA